MALALRDPYMTNLWHDLKYGLRVVANSPGFVAPRLRSRSERRRPDRGFGRRELRGRRGHATSLHVPMEGGGPLASSRDGSR